MCAEPSEMKGWGGLRGGQRDQTERSLPSVSRFLSPIVRERIQRRQLGIGFITERKYTLTGRVDVLRVSCAYWGWDSSSYGQILMARRITHALRQGKGGGTPGMGQEFSWNRVYSLFCPLICAMVSGA
jgi:hypothetical protein